MSTALFDYYEANKERHLDANKYGGAEKRNRAGRGQEGRNSHVQGSSWSGVDYTGCGKTQ